MNSNEEEIYKNTGNFEKIYEDFKTNWRENTEIHQIIITKRMYQISPYSTQF